MTSQEADFRRKRHARIRRAKQFLKFMPRKANLERYPVLKWFAAFARKRPYLWSFKVSSCSSAFYAGSIIAFLPLMGVQIILAFGAALLFRANLPIMVGLQAISNPFTFAFLYFYLNPKVGRTIMDLFNVGLDQHPHILRTQATILGGVIIGSILGLVLDLLYRLAVYEARKLALIPPASPSESKITAMQTDTETTTTSVTETSAGAVPDPEVESSKSISR